MRKLSDNIRLKQEHNLSTLLSNTPINEMITVYYSDSKDTHNHGLYCALIPSKQIGKSLKTVIWDLMHGGGYPEAYNHHEAGVSTTTYNRFGFNNGVEPLIFDRNFHGMRDDYKEISEEFRLFHKLFHDTKENKYIKFDNDGYEDVVAIVEENRIQIRLKEIKQFLAIKEMHLAIQFDYREYSQQSLEELGLSSDDKRDVFNELDCWGINYGEGYICSYKSFSRLLGKKLITPLPKSKSGMWGLAEDEIQKYAEFTIGVDKNGDDITHSANPDLLKNIFGANPEAPKYLTAVHFRKIVLDKYYKQSQKYSISDSNLRCGSLWGVTIDNHHSDKVCVWLGDLGRDMPYREQLHWKCYNIPPVGGVSEVFYRRQLMAEFADSEQPDHIFKILYRNLRDICDEKISWQILHPLAEGDCHHLDSIRIPSGNEQSDFDELVQSITKILIDSINEKKLNNFIPAEDKSEIKGGISRLEKVFQLIDVADYQKHIKFLRDLQGLRSAGSAHRKGTKYKQIANIFELNSRPLKVVFESILVDANKLLEYFIEIVASGKLGK